MQLTPHLHLLVPEAQWSADAEAVEVPPPSDEDVTGILERVLLQAKKSWAELEDRWADDAYEELQPRAIQERLDLGAAATETLRSTARGGP